MICAVLLASRDPESPDYWKVKLSDFGLSTQREGILDNVMKTLHGKYRLLTPVLGTPVGPLDRCNGPDEEFGRVHPLRAVAGPPGANKVYLLCTGNWLEDASINTVVTPGSFLLQSINTVVTPSSFLLHARRDPRIKQYQSGSTVF